MDDKILYWMALAFSAIALVMLVTNVALIGGNRNLQAEVGQRQAMITNAVSLSQVNQGLVQALADTALKTGDKSIKELLAAQGITYKARDAAKTEATKK